MNRKLIQWLGLTGVVALLSYTAAVLFSPLAYPGYDWMAQAMCRSRRFLPVCFASGSACSRS